MTTPSPPRGTATLRIGVADVERRRRPADDERSPLVDQLAELLRERRDNQRREWT